MEHLPPLPPAQIIRVGGRSYRRAGLVLLPRGGLRPRLEGSAVGDPVEPASDRYCLADRPRLAGEDEERRLEGVLGVGLVAQYAAADVEHHYPVTAQQGMKSSLILLCMELLEEFMVRQLAHAAVFDD